jgi:NADPH:quinone reductase-like Zn-dependent oxidoreductase
MSKVIIVQTGGGFDKVRIGQETTQPPKSNQIQIRLHANSLNYHDYAVVSGMWGPATNRIPMADGAGEVIAVGDKVHEFSVGDKVCTTFFPTWLDGEPNVKGFDQVPGDGVDGYAREVVTVHTSAVTHAPKKWDFLQSSTLTTAGLTAWKALFEDYSLKPKHSILIQGTGGVSIYALQFAKAMGAKVIATGVLVGNRAQQIRMIDFINEHHMFPVIDRVFALEKIVEAFQYQESNNHFGKICLKI